MFAPASLSSWLVSVATPPLLCGILARNIYLEVSQAVGQASLELFRGEQLPLLKLSLTGQSAREPRPEELES